MKKQLIYILAASILYACSTSKSKDNEAAEADNSIPVKMQNIQQKTLSQTIVASGVLSSQAEVKLAFKIGGIIEGMYASEGSYVGRGQVLASLNLAEIGAQVMQAELSNEKANRDLKRAENLYQDSVTTLEQLQNANTGQKIAEANLRVVSFNQRYASIYAPVSGRVLKKFAETGEVVGAGAPVFLIGSTEAAWVVKVGLSDRDVVRIKEGDKAKVRMDAHSGIVFEATVSQIAQTATIGTGTYEVELQLENTAKYRMISGFVAKAEIFPSDAPDVMTIPISALTEANGDKGFVYTVENQKAKKIPVSILALTKTEVAIKTEVSTKFGIVTEGADFLTDGVEVRIVK